MSNTNNSNNFQNIQLPTFNFGDKERIDAIEAMNELINNEEYANEFSDHEEIIIRYKGFNGKRCSVHCVVNKKDGTPGYVSALIEENDTIRVVQTDKNFEGEPNDTSVLWISEEEDHSEASDLKTEVKLLKSQIERMGRMLFKHEYALSNTIAGGDIIANSEKYDLENRYIEEEPEDSQYVPEYDTGDTVLFTWGIYIGNTEISELLDDENYHFYRYMRYPLRVRLFNQSGKEIEFTNRFSLRITSNNEDIAKVYNSRILQASRYTESGESVEIKATLWYTEVGEEDPIGSKSYTFIFDENEKPDYETYGIPNVHHMLIKTASSLEVLERNLDYLCVNELCWCVGEHALYLKSEEPDGTEKLYKIIGDIPAPPLTGYTKYNVDYESNLNIESDIPEVQVDENGYLTLVHASVYKGNLILTNYPLS